MKRHKLPRGIWLLSVVLTLVLSAAVACGGAAEPATPSPTKIAEVTVPDTPVPTVEAAPEATVAPHGHNDGDFHYQGIPPGARLDRR